MASPLLVAVVPTEDVLQTIAQADRRFTLHRVLYDLYAQTFPARVGQLVVSLIFCGGAGTYRGDLSLVSPSENIVASATFIFEARTYHIQSVGLTGVELPEPGGYGLRIMLEGQLVMGVPFQVTQG